MKILIIAANYAYSFINQAQSLAKGFREINLETEIIQTQDPKKVKEKLSSHEVDVVLGVGNWPDYKLLVEAPKLLCDRVLPWITADNRNINKFINEYNKLNLVLTPSLHCKSNLVFAGIKEEIIKVLPEAVDPKLWHQMNEKEIKNFLDYLSVPNPDNSKDLKYNLAKLRQEGIPIIFTTGGDATKKGAQEVIRALALLDKKIPWVYLIKTWPYPTIFKKSIEELTVAQKVGVFDRVRYLVGEYSQLFMRGLMSICDIYAAPSRIEGFGLPHIEAQMCGKPVVSIDAVSVRETVIHQKTGFLAKPSLEDGLARADIDDLAKYLKILLTNESLRKQMGKNAIIHARQNYSPKIIASKFLESIKLFK